MLLDLVLNLFACQQIGRRCLVDSLVDSVLLVLAHLRRCRDHGWRADWRTVRLQVFSATGKVRVPRPLQVPESSSVEEVPLQVGEAPCPERLVAVTGALPVGIQIHDPLPSLCKRP